MESENSSSELVNKLALGIVKAEAHRLAGELSEAKATLRDQFAMILIPHLQQQLQQIDELIHKFEAASITDPRPSVLANIRALQKEQRRLQARIRSGE